MSPLQQYLLDKADFDLLLTLSKIKEQSDYSKCTDIIDKFSPQNKGDALFKRLDEALNTLMNTLKKQKENTEEVSISLDKLRN